MFLKYVNFMNDWNLDLSLKIFYDFKVSIIFVLLYKVGYNMINKSKSWLIIIVRN